MHHRGLVCSRIFFTGGVCHPHKGRSNCTQVINKGLLAHTILSIIIYLPWILLLMYCYLLTQDPGHPGARPAHGPGPPQTVSSTVVQVRLPP